MVNKDVGYILYILVMLFAMANSPVNVVQSLQVYCTVRQQQLEEYACFDLLSKLPFIN